MRNKGIWLTVLALLVGMSVAFGQPPKVERYSTGPERDVNRVSIEGKVQKIIGQKAVVRTEDGRDVTVHLGPRSYWNKKGYRLEKGDRITVEGWGELNERGDRATDGEAEGGFIFAGTIRGDGYQYDFMDSRGYPMWADPDDWEDRWSPSFDFYMGWYFGPPGPRWCGPPPPWYWQPPPWYWHRYPYHPHPRWHRGHWRCR